MYFTILGGTDGIGLPFKRVSGIFADNIREARELATEKLRVNGYTVQADKGQFTVHGFRDWSLVPGETGYEIIPFDPINHEPLSYTIPTIRADAYVRWIQDVTSGRYCLTDATESGIDQIEPKCLRCAVNQVGNTGEVCNECTRAEHRLLADLESGLIEDLKESHRQEPR
jgi:hypothetical protein